MAWAIPVIAVTLEPWGENGADSCGRAATARSLAWTCSRSSETDRVRPRPRSPPSIRIICIRIPSISSCTLHSISTRCPTGVPLSRPVPRAAVHGPLPAASLTRIHGRRGHFCSQPNLPRTDGAQPVRDATWAAARCSRPLRDNGEFDPTRARGADPRGPPAAPSRRPRRGSPAAARAGLSFRTADPWVARSGEFEAWNRKCPGRENCSSPWG